MDIVHIGLSFGFYVNCCTNVQVSVSKFKSYLNLNQEH